MEIVLGICFCGLVALLIGDWCARKRAKQDERIEEIKKEIEGLRQEMMVGSISGLKRDNVQMEYIEKLFRLLVFSEDEIGISKEKEE